MIRDFSKIVDNYSIDMLVDFLDAINQTTDDYMYFWEFKTGRFWLNEKARNRFAIPDDGEGYCNISDILEIVHPKDVNGLREDARKLIHENKDTHNMEYRWIDKDGNCVWISCRGVVVKDQKNMPYGMFGRVSDTALKQYIDKRTGLFNKERMNERMSLIFDSEKKGHFLLLGIDNLKEINNTYGRKQGDIVIKQVADVLSEHASTPYTVFRLDGDYFCICSFVTDKDRIVSFYKNIQEDLKDVCTLSVGVVAYDDVEIKESVIIYQYAEQLMNAVKNNGKNSIAFYDKNAIGSANMGAVDELRESVANNCEGFYLVYQPQIKLGDTSVYGVEALLRYKSDKYGVKYPDEFIPILERTGMIRVVGLWVLEQAIKDCIEWRKKYPDFHVSINMSYEQLKDYKIAEKVLDIIDKYNFPGNALFIELTESMHLQDFVHYNEIFAKWKEVGIEIAVDDFGTGYSSLAYLSNLNIDEIKIDRCFVSEIQNSSYNYRLIKNITELARETNIRVCCEGVETADELNVLRGLEAELAQGYYFAKPMPKEDLDNYLLQNNM